MNKAQIGISESRPSIDTMIKKINWSDNFLTGQREVDLQHQYFADLINRIIWEMMELNDASYHQHLIEELILYAHFHFKSEENIMFRLNYEGLQEHKKLHMELIERLTSKISIIEDNTENSIILIDFLVRWFVEHTISEDRKSFEQYRKNGLSLLNRET